MPSDTNTSTVNPLLAAAKAAWLQYAKGTYSETDRKIFIAGFTAGRQHYRRQLEKQERYEQEYERRYGSRRDCY